MPTNQADTDPAHFVDGLELAEKFQIKNVHKGEGWLVGIRWSKMITPRSG
jgi:hypothetical protein